MGRIIGYQYDDNVQDGDAWIGSEDGGGRTKQYTAEAVANYLNIQGKISIVGQMTYEYGVTPLSGPGTFAVFGGGTDPVAFSAVTKLTLSNQDIGGQRVVEFLNLLVGSDILITEQEAISTFGYYSIDSYAVNATDPAYYDLGVTFKSGNGSMEAEQIYEAQNFVLANDATQSPWNTVPDGISYTAADVGIGTETPSEKLEVSGNILSENIIIKNTEGYKAQLNSSELSDDRGFGFPDSSGTLALTSDITASPWDTVTGGINYANGNVGVGTTSPSTTLDVAGSITTSGAITGPALFEIIAQYTNRGRITLSSSTSTNANQISLLTNGNVRMVVNKEGNVGIGTTSPSEKLDVEGDIASQGIYVDRTHESGGISNPFAKFGLHYWWGDSNSINLQKTGNNNRCAFSTQSGYFHVVNASGNNVRITSSDQTVEVGSGILNLGVVQHSAANNNNGKYISISNAGNTSGSRGVVNVNGDFRINDYSTSAEIEKIKLKNDGSAYFTGNVGIGTTSPSEKLDVAGQYGNTTLSGHALGFTRAAGNYLWAKTSGGDLRFTVNGNPIGSASMIINSLGNVGIGTTNPSEKLDVEGNIRVGVNNGFYINNQNVGIKRVANDLVVGGFGGIRFTSSSTTVPNQAERMRITSTGNVGIGTTSPSEKLEIVGGNIKGDGIIQIESTTDNNIIGKLVVDYWSSGRPVLGSVGGSGIAIKEDLSLRFNSGLYGGTTSSNGLTIGTNRVDTPIIFKTSPVTSYVHAEHMRITGAGNVGIGTTAPSEKLEVDGQVLSDGYRLAAMQTAPAARNSTGTLGEIVIDGNHIYVCYATDSWSRVALDTSW